MRLGLELEADKVSEDAAVSASATTKPIGPTTTFCGVTTFVIPEIVGAEFTKMDAAEVLFAELESAVTEETFALFVHCPDAEAVA